MALTLLYRWNQPDSTELFNLKDKDVIPKGVWKGGNVTPGSGLSVDVSPFVVTTIEGATVREDTDTHNVTVVDDGNWYYIGVLHKYVPLGTPVVQVQSYPEASFDAWADKDYFTIFARVKVDAGNLVVDPSDIDDSVKALPEGRLDSVIFIVPAYADLPGITPPSAFPEQIGTINFVASEQRFYIWDGGPTAAGWKTTGSELGAGTAALADGGTTITHNLGHTNYKVSVTPVADAGEDIGEIWVDKQNNDFTVHRSGEATTNFDYMMALSPPTIP